MRLSIVITLIVNGALKFGPGSVTTRFAHRATTTLFGPASREHRAVADDEDDKQTNTRGNTCYRDLIGYLPLCCCCCPRRPGAALTAAAVSFTFNGNRTHALRGRRPPSTPASRTARGCAHRPPIDRLPVTSGAVLFRHRPSGRAPWPLASGDRLLLVAFATWRIWRGGVPWHRGRRGWHRSWASFCNRSDRRAPLHVAERIDHLRQSITFLHLYLRSPGCPIRNCPASSHQVLHARRRWWCERR